MKLQVVTVLCICLAQMCFESVHSELTIDKKNDLRQRVHELLGDISERFVDDAVTIIDKFDDQRFVNKVVSKKIIRMLKRVREHGNVSKIDANSITSYVASIFGDDEVSVEDTKSYIEELKIYHSILSKQVPSETATGMMNMVYVLHCVNATTEDVENAVNYLYSNETVAIKDPLRNFKDLNPSECPKMTHRFSTVQDELKAMTDIRPSVLQDVAIIIERFPCVDLYVTAFLEKFVYIVKKLQSFAEIDKRSISACIIKENSSYLSRLDYNYERTGTFRLDGAPIRRDEIENEMKRIELILATRLMDERFRGIINFYKAVIAETPIDDIQKALEYVFIDVAPSAANCSTVGKS